MMHGQKNINWHYRVYWCRGSLILRL